MATFFVYPSVKRAWIYNDKGQFLGVDGTNGDLIAENSLVMDNNNGLIKQSQERMLKFRTASRMSEIVANAVAEFLPQCGQNFIVGIFIVSTLLFRRVTFAVGFFFVRQLSLGGITDQAWGFLGNSSGGRADRVGAGDRAASSGHTAA